MNEIRQSPKNIIIARLIAVLIAMLAIYIILGIWWAIFTGPEFELWFDLVFLFIFPIPMTLLVIYFAYVAIKVWQSLSYNSICKLSGVFSIILTGVLMTMVEQFKPDDLQFDEIMLTEIELPILMIVAGLLYLAFKRCLLQWFAVEEDFNYYDHKRGTKLYFGFLAFFIYSAISSTVELLPRASDSQYSAENGTLEALLLWGSIPVAYLIYRISIKLFLKKQPKPPMLAEKAMENFKD